MVHLRLVKEALPRIHRTIREALPITIATGVAVAVSESAAIRMHINLVGWRHLLMVEVLCRVNRRLLVVRRVQRQVLQLASSEQQWL